MRRATWGVGLAVFGILVTAGCSGSDTSSPHDRPSVPAQLKQKLLSPDPSPGPRDRADYYRRKNEIMATCMRAAGFEYVPYTPPPSKKESLGLSDEEFTKRYGFGISTLIDYHAPGPTPGGDPNKAIMAKLSDSQLHSYLRARSACEKQVFRQVGPPVGAGTVVGTGDDPVQDLIAEAAAKAEADPRIVQARKKYQTCMVAKGYHVTSAEEITGEISTKAAPYQKKYDAAVSRAKADGQDPATLKLADVLTATQLADLAKLQQDELAAAAADEECGKLLYPVVAQVHHEYLAQALNGG